MSQIFDQYRNQRNRIRIQKMLDQVQRNNHPSQNGHKSKHSSGHRYTASCDAQKKILQKADNGLSNIKTKEQERPNSSKKITLVSNTGFINMGKMRPSAPVSIQRVRTQTPTSSPCQENYFSKIMPIHPISRYSSSKNIVSAYCTPKNQESKISIRQMNSYHQNDRMKNEKLTLANPQKPHFQKQLFKRQQTSPSSRIDIIHKSKNHLKILKTEQSPCFERQIAVARSELIQYFKKYIDEFKYRSFQQAKQIAELQRKLQQNQKSLKHKDRKIQELKKVFSQFQNYKQDKYNSYYVIDRIKDIEIRLQICRQKQMQLRKLQQTINQTLKKIQKGSLQHLSSKISQVISKVKQFISFNNQRLKNTEQQVQKMVSNNIGKIQLLSAGLKTIHANLPKNQLFKSLISSVNLNKSSGFSGVTKNTQQSIFSFGKFQDFQFTQEPFSQSISSDYFCYPDKNQRHISIQSPTQQKKAWALPLHKIDMPQSIKNLIDLFEKQPRNLFVDAGGHLRYKDSGIYVFDKKTSGLITLNQQQKIYLSKRGLLQKKESSSLKKRAFV